MTLSPEPSPRLRFGVIADPQYASIPPARNRYYAESLRKLSEAIASFNAMDLDFVVTLGDVIDRDRDSYEGALRAYRRLRHPARFVLGNHDFAVAPEHVTEVPRILGLEQTYYTFAACGIRFIVLDGNEISLFATIQGSPRHALARQTLARLVSAGAVNAQNWNGGMSDEQFAWLKTTLEQAEAAGERSIVLGHYPLYPENEHNMWDAEGVVDLLCSTRGVLSYLCGHNHAGNYGARAGKHFVTFKGMVETADVITFALVEVYSDRLEITGYGDEVSRTLPI